MTLTTRLTVVAAALAFTWTACKTGGSHTSDDDGGSEVFSHSLDIADRGRFFASEAEGRPAWVKFMIKLDEPSLVYFQDSQAFTFHYDFATKHLPEFVGVARPDFDAVALRLQGQKLLLGAVVVPPTRDIKEFAIQFVGLDPYDVETIAKHYATVRAAIRQPANVPFRDFYLPVYEQQAAARQDEAVLKEKGIEVTNATRWLKGSQCYSDGWTIGRLTRVAADKIDKAYGDGLLTPDDVLLTDGIPAEVPPVRGIISLAPATPNSHVALLAQSFRIPFVFLAEAADRERAIELAGRTIGLELRGANEGGGCTFKLMDLTDGVPATEVTRLMRLKAPPILALQPIAQTGKLLIDVAGLTDQDVTKAGGKSVGMSVLRTVFPETFTEARALTFDTWLEFLALPYGNSTIGGQIATRLAPFTTYPPNIAQVKAALKSIRKLVKDTAMPAALKQRVVQALQDAGYVPERGLRFRSSTNVEDTANFNGAGLYDSFSGCLADDLDQDDAGPSVCDATDAEEKGVIRAIQKVYASFYNDNAFLERLRHGVNDSEVGMALLVHYSFPDADEYANGVVTLTYADGDETFKIVSQPGAASVTNPDAESIPEVVNGYAFGDNVSISPEQGSSLLQLGARVLKEESRYQELVALTRRVATEFKSRHSDRTAFVLDFEYKLVTTGQLTLKQVREVPILGARQPTVPWLAAGTTSLCLRHDEGAQVQVFGRQRLQTRFEAVTRGTALTRQAIGQSLFVSVGEEHIDLDGKSSRVDGPTSGREGYAFGGTEDGSGSGDFAVVETWRRPLSSDKSTALTVRTEVLGEVDARTTLPVVLPADLVLYVTARYSSPMPTMYEDAGTTTEQDFVNFGACQLSAAGEYKRTRQFAKGGVEVASDYWLPREPTGFSAGFTAALNRFEKTTITGLTTEPLVLTSAFAQSFVPEHHNFTEHLVFQPTADPKTTEAQRNELAAKDVLYIYANSGGDIWLFGKDGARAL